MLQKKKHSTPSVFIGFNVIGSRSSSPQTPIISTARCNHSASGQEGRQLMLSGDFARNARGRIRAKQRRQRVEMVEASNRRRAPVFFRRSHTLTEQQVCRCSSPAATARSSLLSSIVCK
jgi:hypothetical protein